MKPETAFENQVVDVAHIHGWHVAHFSPAQVRPGVWVTPFKADAKGFPDLTLVRERIVFAELKMPGKKLAPEQSVWQAKILGAGGEHHVWTPDDLDEINRVLRERRPTAAADTLRP